MVSPRFLDEDKARIAGACSEAFSRARLAANIDAKQKHA
jgi:hypothetical protein